MADYLSFCSKLQKQQYAQVPASAQPQPDLENGEIHNPFAAPNNEELSFLGRDPNEVTGNIQLKANHYRRDASYELYGPLWIYVTLLVEFVILGHLTNQMQNSSKQGNPELFTILATKTADQSLKRIMKIGFFLACFYFGVPSVTYLMFKNRQALEVSYIQQLSIMAYSYVVLIPGSLLIFALQQFSRFKYFMILLIWILQLFFLYKSMYEIRGKYFDFAANKQMAWFLGSSSFLFMWIYKSYFMQI